jgi:hypothetical protein
MSKAPYINNMTMQERAACMRAGAIMKLAHLQIPPENADTAIKSAVSLGGAIDATAKTVVVGALLTGIPVGIMAHMISKKVGDVRRKERELGQKIEYYRDAAQSLESGLAQAGVKA